MTHRGKLSGSLLPFTFIGALCAQDKPRQHVVAPIRCVHTASEVIGGVTSDAEGTIYIALPKSGSFFKLGDKEEADQGNETMRGISRVQWMRPGRWLGIFNGQMMPMRKRGSEWAVGGPGIDIAQVADFVIDSERGIFIGEQEAGLSYLHGRTISKDLTSDGIAALTFDASGKALHVITTKPELLTFQLSAAGQLGERRLVKKLDKGGSSLCTDLEGNLYVAQTSLGIVRVFTASGEPLETIVVPDQPTACAFGGNDNKTLYIAAGKSVYAAGMSSPGFCNARALASAAEAGARKAQLQASLRWHFQQLIQFKLKHRRWPSSVGAEFVIAPWTNRITERTKENFERYWCIGHDAKTKAALQKQPIAKVWSQSPIVDAEAIGFVGPIKGTRRNSVKVPLMAMASPFPDGSLLVLMGSGMVRTIEVDPTKPVIFGTASKNPILRQLQR